MLGLAAPPAAAGCCYQETWSGGKGVPPAAGTWSPPTSHKTQASKLWGALVAGVFLSPSKPLDSSSQQPQQSCLAPHCAALGTGCAAVGCCQEAWAVGRKGAPSVMGTWPSSPQTPQLASCGWDPYNRGTLFFPTQPLDSGNQQLQEGQSSPAFSCTRNWGQGEGAP